VTPEREVLHHLCSLMNIDPPEDKVESMFLSIAEHYKGKIPPAERRRTLSGPKPAATVLTDEGRKRISEAQKARHSKGKQ